MNKTTIDLDIPRGAAERIRRRDMPANRAITALRAPDASLARVPNTVRQAIADVIEAQQRQIDKYGLALMMIREGCADPQGFARETLARAPEIEAGTDDLCQCQKCGRTHRKLGFGTPPAAITHRNINECPSCKRMFIDGETCGNGGCPMGGDF